MRVLREKKEIAMNMHYPVCEIVRRQEALDRDRELIRKIVASIAGMCEQVSREQLAASSLSRRGNRTGWMLSLRSVNDNVRPQVGHVIYLVNGATAFNYDVLEKRCYFSSQHLQEVKSSLQDLVDNMVRNFSAVQVQLDEIWAATN